MKMKIFAGGREIDVPTDGNGNVDVVEVRRAANIPDDRSLIQQKPSGENFILPRSGRFSINPYDRFMGAPRAERGYR